MPYRKLRIAWSVAWGVVALSLCALWVRSYSYWDEFYNPISNKTLVVVESASGRVILVLSRSSPGSPWIWHISQELNGQYWAGPLQENQQANRNAGIAGFAHYTTPWNNTYSVPTWSLAMLSATIAAAAWLRWSNRFSLRTLLIAMTLLALGLGAIAWISAK